MIPRLSVCQIFPRSRASSPTLLALTLFSLDHHLLLHLTHPSSLNSVISPTMSTPPSFFILGATGQSALGPRS